MRVQVDCHRSARFELCKPASILAVLHAFVLKKRMEGHRFARGVMTIEHDSATRGRHCRGLHDIALSSRREELLPERGECGVGRNGSGVVVSWARGSRHLTSVCESFPWNHAAFDETGRILTVRRLDTSIVSPSRHFTIPRRLAPVYTKSF